METVIAVAGVVSAIVLGWTARGRDIKKETKDEASTAAALKSDVQYIKGGVDDIRIDLRAQGQKVDVLCERVAIVEESNKQSHKRIDRLEEVRS